MKKIILLSVVVLIVGILAYIGFVVKRTPVLSQHNPTYTFQLPSNPSTGYSWILASYDKNLLELKEHHFIASKTQRIGAGGFEQWTIGATQEGLQTAPHKTVVVVHYKRPWEKEVNPLTKLNITIRIR